MYKKYYSVLAFRIYNDDIYYPMFHHDEIDRPYPGRVYNRTVLILDDWLQRAKPAKQENKMRNGESVADCVLWYNKMYDDMIFHGWFFNWGWDDNKGFVRLDDWL